MKYFHKVQNFTVGDIFFNGGQVCFIENIKQYSRHYQYEVDLKYFNGSCVSLTFSQLKRRMQYLGYQHLPVC